MEDRGRGSIAGVLSLCAHGALAILIARAPRAEARALRDPRPIELAIDLAEPDAAPAAPSVGPPTPPAPRPPHRTIARVDRAPRVSAETPLVAPAPAPTAIGPWEPPPSDPVAPLRPPIDLSPRAVAERAVSIDGAPSARRPAQTDRGELAPLSPDEARRRLDEWIGQRVDEVPHRARAERMIARPQTDGTYVYEGTVFRAVIGEDGSITFHDHPPIRTDGFSASGSIDPDGALLRAAGQDPYAAQREQFREHNEELIARLELEWRAARMQEGLIALRGEVIAIWQSSRSRAARLRAIFARWDEVDETGGGGEARAVIERAVRELCPPGSADAITPAELDALDAHREHATSRFDPYR